MKFLANVLLFFFLLAQMAPTVISMLDFDDEISLSIIEENEKSKDEKELKSDFIISKPNEIQFFDTLDVLKITKKYLIKKYQTDTSIDILPPIEV